MNYQYLNYPKKGLAIALLLYFNTQIILASPGHGSGGEESESIVSAKSKYPVVTVVKSTSLDEAIPNVEATGKVLPKYTSDIFASRDGIISEMKVDLGDFVEKGQIVAILLPDKDQAQLRSEFQLKKKELEILQKRQWRIDEQDEDLPIVTEIQTAQKNLEATKQENLAEAEKIAAQIEIIGTKVEVQAFAFQNGIRDALDVMSRFLFTDSSFLEREQLTSPSSFRRSGFFTTDSIAQSKVRVVEQEFIAFYRIFREDPNAVKVTDILRFGNDVRQLASQARPNQQSKEIYQAIRIDLDEAVDHLSEVLTEALDNQNEIKTLEAEKKRLLISNTQRSIVATNETISLEKNRKFSSFELDIEREQKQAEMRSISQQLGFGAYVRAPFSGKITKRHLNIGDSVGGDKPIYSIVDSSHKFIRFFVTESQFPFIEKDKEILFSPSSAPSQKYKAKIARIAPSIDPETQTILIEADLANDDANAKILAHMNVRVELPIFNGDEDYIVIPEKAVTLSGSPTAVWIVNDKVEAERIEIEIAYIYGGKAFVAQGLTGNEWLIIKTPVKLENDLEINTKLNS